MPGRPCSICRDSAKARRAAELIAAGASDQAIADAISAGRAAVQRHRTAHIVAPARALVEAAAKGREVRERREEMLAAAESGDPSAFVALASIVDDLRRVHQRLERTADAAEQDNQRLAVASLSSQQLRTAEVRAKIGGVGGYAAPRVREGEGAPVFALTINLPGQTERIVATAEPIGGPPTLEVDAGPVGPRSVFRIPAMLPDEPRRADPKVSNEFGARSTSCSISATKLSLLKPDLADCANGLGRDPAGTPSWSPRRVGYSVS